MTGRETDLREQKGGALQTLLAADGASVPAKRVFGSPAVLLHKSEHLLVYRPSLRLESASGWGGGQLWQSAAGGGGGGGGGVWGGVA